MFWKSKEKKETNLNAKQEKRDRVLISYKLLTKQYINSLCINDEGVLYAFSGVAINNDHLEFISLRAVHVGTGYVNVQKVELDSCYTNFYADHAVTRLEGDRQRWVKMKQDLAVFGIDIVKIKTEID